MSASRIDLSEECFEHFDSMFDSLSSERAWKGQAEAKPVAAPEAAAGAPTLVVEAEGDSLEQLREAFDLLDTQLAQTGRGAATPPAGSPPTLPAAPAPRNALRIAHPRRSVNGAVALMAIVDLVHDLSLVERRARQSSGRVWMATDEGHAFVAGLFDRARQLAADLDLETVRVRAEFARQALQAGASKQLAGEAAELIRHLRHDLHRWSLCPTR